MTTVTLYRPVGTKELALIEASDWRAFPPRLPEQPIFYPVTNEAYARQIARDWNAQHNDDRRGYVTQFGVNEWFLHAYDSKVVGGREHEEYWIPAEELPLFNDAIEGLIEVIATYIGGERFGLDGDQYDYVTQLAINAGYGRWCSDAEVCRLSVLFLEGGMVESDKRRPLITELLRLAAYDKDHEWEAPILTGRPTEYAIAALNTIAKQDA